MVDQYSVCYKHPFVYTMDKYHVWFKCKYSSNNIQENIFKEMISPHYIILSLPIRFVWFKLSLLFCNLWITNRQSKEYKDNKAILASFYYA
jgi:hypothetical protein